MGKRNLREILSGRPRGHRGLADQAPAILVCALFMAAVLGVAGWIGQGLPGRLIGSGAAGLLAGAAAGLALTFAGSLTLLGVMAWISGGRTRSRIVAIALWVLIVGPALWSSGWAGVPALVLRFVPVLVVFGAISGLFLLAQRWQGSMDLPVVHDQPEPK